LMTKTATLRKGTLTKPRKLWANGVPLSLSLLQG
jgi:hypothetical protein